MIKKKYKTQEEKNALISQYEDQGYTLTEERNYINESSLCFELTTETEKKVKKFKKSKDIFDNIKNDSLWMGISDTTNKQIEGYVDMYVHNLEDAKKNLKYLLNMVAYILKTIEK